MKLLLLQTVTFFFKFFFVGFQLLVFLCWWPVRTAVKDSHLHPRAQSLSARRGEFVQFFPCSAVDNVITGNMIFSINLQRVRKENIFFLLLVNWVQISFVGAGLIGQVSRATNVHKWVLIVGRSTPVNQVGEVISWNYTVFAYLLQYCRWTNHHYMARLIFLK